MKKLNKLSAILIIFLCHTAYVFAQSEKDAFDITSSFRAWLLGNEASVMSSINADEQFIKQITPTLAFAPFEQKTTLLAYRPLLAVHRKFYRFLSEIQDIYAKARRYGNGRLAILFKRHRPELYALTPLGVPGLTLCASQKLREAYHANLLVSLNLNPKTDTNLSKRLIEAAAMLNSDETRMLYDYFDIFSALYPNNKTTKFIKAFMQNGAKQPLSAGIRGLLNPSFSATGGGEEIEDPLAELERLVGITNGSKQSDSTNLNQTEASKDQTEEGNSSNSLNTEASSAEANDEYSDPFEIWPRENK